MFQNAQLVAFVATTNAEQAKQFYAGALELPLAADEPHALVFDASGTTLRVAKVNEVHPAPYTILGWNVADLDSTVAQLAARQVPLERFAGIPQDEQGICTFPSGARVAWFKDPDGNLLSISQSPASS